MKLRLIECFIPKHIFVGIDNIVDECKKNIIWYNVSELGSSMVIRILATLNATEAIVDMLNKEYGGSNFRIIVFEPTTTVPTISGEKEDKTILDSEEVKKGRHRLSRHEIYDKLFSIMNSPNEYYLMLIISTIVASIGLLRNDVAIIIASMIIAPLLSPNISLSFSIGVADWELAKKSLHNLFFGIGSALAFSILLGFLVPISIDNPQISSRLSIGLMDVVIALCAGVVGAVSTASGISSVVIGVMIAVALLPPLVAFGLMVGSGHAVEAIPILLLFIINIIGINLSSILVFYAYGISPYKWWKKEKAKNLTIISVMLWFVLLFMAVTILYLKY